MERRSSRSDDSGDRGSRRGSRDDDSSSRRGREETSDRGSRRGRDDDSRGGSTGSSKGFSYQKRSAEDVNKRANQGGKDFDVYVRDDIKTFSPNNGPNTIRILPPTWDKPKHYGIDIWVHYGVGPDSQSYLCLHKMKGEACPICDELQRARQDREDEEYVKNLEPTKRVLFYMVDREHDNEGVQAWASPWTIDRDITKVSIDRKTGDVLPIDDPADGYDVEFDRTGKGVGTKYVGLAISRRSSELGKPAWLDFAIDNPLPSILEYYSYDHIKKAFGGGTSSRDQERPASRSESSGRGGDRDSRSDRDREDRGGRDQDRGRSERGRSQEPEHTWESIHALEGDALDKLIEDEDLDVNPNKFDSDEALADAICDALKVEKVEAKRGREDAGDGDRLSEMRRRRER